MPFQPSLMLKDKDLSLPWSGAPKYDKMHNAFERLMHHAHASFMSNTYTRLMHNAYTSLMHNAYTS